MMNPSLGRPGEIAEPQTAIETALLALDPDWMALADLLIGDGPDGISADYVLMHPQRGVALIDVAPGHGEDAVAGFRNFLENEDFAQFFPGYLPIVGLLMRPEDAPQLAARLDAALASLPPLGIVEPDWAEMVNTLLIASEAPSSADRVAAEDAAENGEEPPLDEPQFAAGGFAASQPAPAWRDEIAVPPRPAAKIGPNTPRLMMSGPLTDERLAPTEERRRWPAIVLILVVLLGAGAGWAVLHPSILSGIPSLARLMPAASTQDSNPPAPTAPLAATPAPAELPPVAQDAPVTPPAADAPAPSVAASNSDAAAPKPAVTAPSITAVAPPLAEPNPPPPSSAMSNLPAPSPPTPNATTDSSAPNAATANDATPAPPQPVVKPAPHKSLAAKRPPAAAKPAPAKEAQAPTQSAREAARAARRAAAAEATDNLNRAELNSPTQPLRLPDEQRQSPSDSVAWGQRSSGFGDGNVAPRPPAPLEDRTIAAQPPPAAANESVAPTTPFAQPAPGALSRPTSLLPSSSRAAAAQATADNGLPQGASLGNQSEAADGRVCRIYNSTKTVLGRPQQVTGLACKGSDGRWQLVTEAPVD
jgi:hypothetical protein